MATTRVTSEGWLSRLWDSITGVLFGILLFLIAFPLLFWNEGRAVKTARALATGKSQVVSVGADKVDPANEGKLVHLTGMATTEETLSDPEFGVQAPKALRLSRTVEMYQWQQNEKTEKKKKLGGGEETVTTYTYEQVWSKELLDSSNYEEPKHDNPGSMPFESDTWEAQNATVGAFKLGALLEQMADWKSLPVEEARNGLKTKDGLLYSSADPAKPAVGDTKIKFDTVQPAEVSLVGVQKADTFAPFDSGDGGGEVFRLVSGKQTAEQMFSQMEAENTAMTWVLRGVGYFMMVIGISLVFRPLAVVADIVPFFGNLLESGIAFIAFALATPFTLITIAIGWIFYRPLLGIALLLVAGGIIFFAFKKANARKAG